MDPFCKQFSIVGTVSGIAAFCKGFDPQNCQPTAGNQLIWTPSLLPGFQQLKTPSLPSNP